jgi:hypothetical protein
MLAALSLVIRQYKKRKNTGGGIGDKNINAKLHGVFHSIHINVSKLLN